MDKNIELSRGTSIGNINAGYITNRRKRVAGQGDLELRVQKKRNRRDDWLDGRKA